ncbi:hypothetical protein KEJ19_07470, partial [Candidatus Bathyarchaeota archaeon]|nr:hypothetical protein [Candidatus Bathyarchaeota archaeon]
AETQTYKRTKEDANGNSPSLKGLPWKPYRKGEGAWIFSNLPEASELKACLEKAPGKTLTIGGFRYRLQGDDRFIARYPLKHLWTDALQAQVPKPKTGSKGKDWGLDEKGRYCRGLL